MREVYEWFVEKYITPKQPSPEESRRLLMQYLNSLNLTNEELKQIRNILKDT